MRFDEPTQSYAPPGPVAVFAILLDARNPKRFPCLDVHVVTTACNAPLPFELHQSSTIEVDNSAGSGLLHVRNPSGTIVGMPKVTYVHYVKAEPLHEGHPRYLSEI